MPKSLRVFVERLLPWYNPLLERQRNARTERVARRSEGARARAARVIAEYRRAEARADAAAERVIDEVAQ